MPAPESRLWMRSASTCPAEPSWSRIVSVFRTSACKDPVLGALRIDEIAAGDDVRRLQLAVDAAVALLQPRWIPRQVEMDEVVAAGLEVDAFARGVGAEQDAKRLLRPGSALKASFTCSRRSCPVMPVKVAMRSSPRSVSANASLSRRSSQSRVSSHSVKMISRRSFQASSPVIMFCLDPVDQPFDARVGLALVALRDLQHRLDTGDRLVEARERRRDAVGRGFRDLVLLRLGAVRAGLPRRASLILRHRGVSAISAAAALGRRGSAPCRGAVFSVFKMLARLRANAGIDDSSRCWSPDMRNRVWASDVPCRPASHHER